MTATLDAIESALFVALQALHAVPLTTTRPFAMVDRWAGEVSQDEEVDEATLGRSPSALLAFEGSLVEGEDGALDETLGRDFEVLERHVFRVYLTVRDTRGDTKALKGAAVGQSGVLRCAQLVKEALAGLAIPGLHGGDVVRLVDHRPWSIKRGRYYAHIVRFSARASLSATTPTPDGVPFTGMSAAFPDGADDADDPPHALAVVGIDP